MAADELPWDQNPGYLAMTRRDIPPGGRTNYVVPRPEGVTPADKTSFHPGQANWGKDNLTPIMYELYPSQAWKTFAQSGLPPVKLDARGREIEEAYPEPDHEPRLLLAFDILPDRIGTRESSLLMEEWRRWDGRIRWQDISMRMSRPRPIHNILNMRASRMRAEYCLLSWHAKAKHNEDNAVRDAILARLTDQQIASNTTRGTTPGQPDPSLDMACGVVPHPPDKPGPWKIKNATGDSTQASGNFKKMVPEPEYSEVQTDQEDYHTGGENAPLETTQSDNTVHYKESERYGSDSTCSSQRTESDIEDLEPTASRTHELCCTKRKRQGTCEIKKELKKENDILKAANEPSNVLVENPRWLKLQRTLGNLARNTSNSGHSHERSIESNDPNPVSYLAHMEQNQTYNSVYLNASSVSHEPYSNTSHPLTQNLINQNRPRNTANCSIQDQFTTLDITVPGEGLMVLIMANDPGSRSPGTLVGADPVETRSDSLDALPLDPTEPWDPTQEVDIGFWEYYFNLAGSRRNQGLQPAGAVDEDNWLAPEYVRAGWSDLFTTY